MRIIGIDPGIAIIGYGIIDVQGNSIKSIEYGSIVTDASLPLPNRLKILYDELSLLIAQYRPEEFAIEELFFNKNVKTALVVGHGRGVAILAASNNNLPVYEYTPLQVKQGVVGYGRAQKQQVGEMVRMILGLREVPRPDDVADALAVAICHYYSRKLNRIIEESY